MKPLFKVLFPLTLIFGWVAQAESLLEFPNQDQMAAEQFLAQLNQEYPDLQASANRWNGNVMSQLHALNYYMQGSPQIDHIENFIPNANQLTNLETYMRRVFIHTPGALSEVKCTKIVCGRVGKLTP